MILWYNLFIVLFLGVVIMEKESDKNKAIKDSKEKLLYYII